MAEQTRLAVVKALGKECTKCCVWKPLGEFSKCSKGRFGLHSHCKSCAKKDRRRRNHERQDARYGKKEATRRRVQWEKLESAPKGHKYCFHCDKIKPSSEFNKGGRSKAKLSTYCRPCAAHWAKKQSSKSPLGRLRVAFNTAKGAARRKNLPCTLTVKDLVGMWDAQDGKCFYSGVLMSYAGDHLPESVSVDRIDNTKGYTPDNVVLSCVAVNRMKYTHPKGEFLRWCGLVTEHCKEV